MKPISAIIYDCEIINCVPGQGEPDPTLKYCAGWDDHANMGISCIGVYDFLDDRYRVFLPDNLDEFQALALDRAYVLGFNSTSFDDELCRANGIKIQTTYDLLRWVRRAANEPEEWTPGVSSKGFALENLARANLGYGKSGNGALAPVLWQRGEIGKVVDYCLQDVQITRKLVETGCKSHGGLNLGLKDPRPGFEGKVLRLPTFAGLGEPDFWRGSPRQG